MFRAITSLPKDMAISQLTELYADFLNKITLNVVNSNFQMKISLK